MDEGTRPLNPEEKPRAPESSPEVASGRMENVRGGTARAPRYVVNLPVQYRPVREGDAGWQAGRTADVSRSGLRFETAAPLEPNSLVEITLKMPVPVVHQLEASVVCMGRIVRVIRPAANDGRSEVAATIVSYYFVREKAVPDA